MPPTTQTIPEGFPYEWASDWGEDSHGNWLEFSANGITQVMRWIPPGTFLMGSPEGELDRREYETQHQVTLSKGFWLANTACSQALWEEIMGSNPSYFKGGDLPVEQINTSDVEDFLNQINKRKLGFNLYLPTEAQWEYACRAGTETPFWFGENITPEQANYHGLYPYADGEKGLFRNITLPLKTFQPNSWGLYQMHGNIWEWCADRFGDYPTEPVTDPTGPETGEYRITRGGGYFEDARFLRSAFRDVDDPQECNNYCGFRFALSPAQH